MSTILLANPYDFEDAMVTELGRSRRSRRRSRRKSRRKKRVTRRRRIFKKIGKGLAVAATGGAALALMKKPRRLAKRIIKRKPLRTAIKRLREKKPLRAAIKRLQEEKPVRTALKEAFSPSASLDIIKKVKETPSTSAKSKNDMAKIVTAKLVAELGPPLSSANKTLAKMDLQRIATYEHNKLMRDADFRKKVLTLLAEKAANGNQSCMRTIRVILQR